MFSALASVHKVPSQPWDELGPVWESPVWSKWRPPPASGPYLGFTLKGCPGPGPSLVSALRPLPPADSDWPPHGQPGFSAAFCKGSQSGFCCFKQLGINV